MRDIMLEFENLTYRLLEIDAEKKEGKIKKYLKRAGLVGAGALGAVGTLAGIGAVRGHSRRHGGEEFSFDPPGGYTRSHYHLPDSFAQSENTREKSSTTEILNEEVLLAVATALGIVLSAHFIGLYRARKKLKEKCKNLKNPKQLKTCMIQAEIILLKTERTEIANQRSKCATNKRNPERCKQKLTEMIKDYDIKIKEKELQLKNI